MDTDVKFMKEALKEAKKAYDLEEVPIGAVIVKNNKVIARAHNIKEIKQDATRHAEIIAIEKASKKLKNWRLEGCALYVTLEPCAMCTGAIIQSRIERVIIGTMDLNAGACGSVLNLIESYKMDSIVDIKTNIMQTECQKILQQFFKELRKNKK